MRGKEKFFNDVDIPKPSENQSKFCEEDLTELDLYNSLKSMEGEKSLVKNGWTKEFYETFWNERKEKFLDFVLEAEEKGHWSTSQGQAFIKPIEKKIEIRDSFKTGDPFLCWM